MPQSLKSGEFLTFVVKFMEIGVYEKSLDFQGRVVFPAALRSTFKDFLMFVYKDYVKLVPKKHAKLTDFSGAVEVDVPLDGDYHKLKKALIGKKYGGV